jgi:hypothetical protein
MSEHKYPSNYGPSVHWATDMAWEIMDTLPVGVLTMEQRCFLAGQITGMLIKERLRGGYSEARDGLNESLNSGRRPDGIDP